jgi:Cu(I)/Ag(I) efflux system membrane fusion protein
MKPNPPTLIAGFVATLLLGAGLGYGFFATNTGRHDGHPHAATAPDSPIASPAAPDAPQGKPVYTCPMHPQVVQDHPGQCPICGMDLVAKQAATPTPMAAAPASRPADQGKPVYTCPMHPQVVSDHPGQCPICGMDLVLKQAAPAAHAHAASPELEPGVQAISLSPRQRVLANIQTTAVGRASVDRTLDVTGRIVPDESRLTSISAWIDGRIDYLAVKTTGATIGKGAEIARIYSPELVATQQEFLTARRSAGEVANSPYQELATNARAMVSAARQRLALMGLSEAQIRLVEARNKPILAFPILAPAAGTVVERKVQQGQYVKAGDTLFNLEDYSRVWVEVSAYEADLPGIKPGVPAEVRVNALPGKVFAGKVAFIQPVLTAATRTGQVRIELPNPQGLLKPEMYATVRLQTSHGNAAQLVVPASAVIATGQHHVVYVEVADNQFEPRPVMVGPKAGDRYPVYSGLKAGEKVATSGAFLLDASAQLGGANPHAGHESAP